MSFGYKVLGFGSGGGGSPLSSSIFSSSWAGEQIPLAQEAVVSEPLLLKLMK